MQAVVSSVMVFAGVPPWTTRPTHLLVDSITTDAARGIAGDNGVLQGACRPRGHEAQCHPAIAATSTGDGVGLQRARKHLLSQNIGHSNYFRHILHIPIGT